MKNYTDSDYALNKYSGGIVYRFADGIVEITLADYLAGNPGKTEADFRALKEISDGIYLEQVQDDNKQTYRNSPYDELDGTLLCHAPSPEDLFIGEIEADEEAERYFGRSEAARHAMGKLTSTQRRRYLMYHVKGMTIRKIAEIERVSHVAIVYSLELADKKMKKLVSEG